MHHTYSPVACLSPVFLAELSPPLDCSTMLMQPYFCWYFLATDKELSEDPYHYDHLIFSLGQILIEA